VAILTAASEMLWKELCVAREERSRVTHLISECKKKGDRYIDGEEEEADDMEALECILDFLTLSAQQEELKQRSGEIEKTRKHLIKQLRQIKQAQQKQKQKQKQKQQQQRPRGPDECSPHTRSGQARMRTELHAT
jgi:hypothetical protein